MHLKKRHIILFFCTISLLTLQGQQTDKAKQRFDRYFFEAQRQKDIGKPDAQLESLLMCLTIDSTNAATNSELGILYAKINQPIEAEKRMSKAVIQSPKNWWYRIQYIRLLTALEEYEKAIEQAEETKQLFPLKEEIYTLLATLYKQTGELNKGIKTLNQLEVYTGVNETLSFEKFQLYALLDQEAKAINEIHQLIKKYPKEYQYKVLLGDIFLEKKDKDKALKIYQEVLEKDPNNPYVYISLSNYYKATNQTQFAKKYILLALKNKDLPIDRKMQILEEYTAQLLQNKEKTQEIEDLLKMLIEMYPLEEMPYTYYAEFLQSQHRTQEAYQVTESILNINPKNEAAWNTALSINLQKKDTIAILNLTKKAIQALPQTPSFYFYRAIAFYQQGKLDKALETNQKAIKTIGNTANNTIKSTFYGQMADIYYQLGDKNKAFENYEKALLENPTNTFVMNNYAYYLSLEKNNLAKAEKLSAKTVTAEPNNSTYLDTYAWILYERENYSLAKYYIHKAIDNLDKDDDPTVIYKHSAEIYYALKEYDKAIEIWEKAQITAPNDKNIKKRIKDTQQHIEQQKK